MAVPEPGRRTFLRAAGAVGAAGGIALLSACSRPMDSSATGNHISPAARPAATGSSPAEASWTGLAHDLSGHLIRPGASGYGAAARLFDPRFDGLHPAGIAYCRTPQDVAACLAFARKYRVPAAPRCGGHSYAGWSSTTGLIVDVTEMSSVSVDTAAGTAAVGAGTRLVDFCTGLAAKGRAVPGGSCPTVGISGLTLGGGVGVVARAYGLTRDNLTSLQVVTADGKIRTVDAEQDSDLSWACRGGGGGNFGVATSFTFRTRELSSLEKLPGAGGAATGTGGVAFDALGGAVSRVGAGDTAFVHRDGLFLAQYTTGWGDGATATQVDRQHAWLRSFYATGHRYASGQAYQNYIDPDLTGWRQACYGANYAGWPRSRPATTPATCSAFPRRSVKDKDRDI